MVRFLFSGSTESFSYYRTLFSLLSPNVALAHSRVNPAHVRRWKSIVDENRWVKAVRKELASSSAQSNVVLLLFHSLSLSHSVTNGYPCGFFIFFYFSEIANFGFRFQLYLDDDQVLQHEVLFQWSALCMLSHDIGVFWTFFNPRMTLPNSPSSAYDSLRVNLIRQVVNVNISSCLHTRPMNRNIRQQSQP